MTNCGTLALHLPSDLALPASSPAPQTRLLKTAITRAQLLRLALRGLNARQASEALSISVYSARSHYADPSFRSQVMTRVEGSLAYADEKFDAQAKTLHAKLAEAGERAFDELVDMLGTKTTPLGLRVKIGLEMMDRHPELSATRKSEVHHTHALTAGDLALAARTASEMTSDNPNIIPIRKVG